MGKVVAISGGFDPIHKGHIEYMRLAKKLAGPTGKVVCILNSDEFLINKKGFAFQNYEERKAIIESIKYVDVVMACLDKDQSVCFSLQILKPDIFAKGGDRFSNNIPEYAVCQRLGIEIVDGLGEKIQSSSSLVARRHENV